MKKIVSNILVVSTQLLLGGLFLVSLFSNVSENNTVVENKNLNKMADAVSYLFLNEDDNLKIEMLSDDTVTEVEEEVITVEEKEVTIEVVEEEIEEPVYENSNISYEYVDIDYTVLDTYVGTLTGYGPDCYGCSGMTSSGYDVSNSITYSDYQYGEVRIVAADSSIPLYSIVRISNIPGSDPIIAIVLDRGGNVGFNRFTLFDLLFSSESSAIGKTDNVTFEILRRGN